MRKTGFILATVAGFAISATALAQPVLQLKLVSDQDLSLLSDGINNPTFFVGSNPSVCALVGDNLFIAGYRNNTDTSNPVPNATEKSGQMVKIENIFGARAFRAVPSSIVSPLPAFRGFYGLQYDYGPARAGLVLNYDSGATGTAGAFKVYDVDTQLNPILVQSSSPGLAPRGGAGPAFDYGHDGAGFVLGSNGSGLVTGPVIAVLDFAGYTGSVQAKGPFGIRSKDVVTGDGSGLNNAPFSRVYDGNSVDGMGNSAAPIINTAGTNGVTVSGTLWRDIAIDPRNGTLAARASNDVIIARRNANNGTLSHVVISCPAGETCDDIPFQFMQRVEITWGSAAGDYVIYNKYGTGATDVNGWLKAADINGNEVIVQLKDLDGSSPFSVANTSGVFDLSWDAINKRLAVLDFTRRHCYIFQAAQDGAPQCPPCAADFNDDGGVDGSDVEAFFSAFAQGVSCADVNDDGGVDGSDVEFFFGLFAAGGC